MFSLGGSGFDWLYLFQGTRHDGASGLDETDHRWYNSTLGRWTSPDPILFERGDTNLYRGLAHNPIRFTDPSGLDVYVYYVEGAQIDAPKNFLDGNHLEKNIIDPLKKVFADAKDVHWQGYQVGFGATKKITARSIEEDIAKQCNNEDKYVLIGYSWGGYVVTEALRLSYLDLTGRERKKGGQLAPSFHVNLVYTIDPVIGTPGVNAKDKYSNTKLKTGDGEKPGMWGMFDKWYNWYQQVDDKGSIPGLKVRGAYIDDPRAVNKEFGAADFKNPKGAHIEITEKEEIRTEIEKGIKSLRN